MRSRLLRGIRARTASVVLLVVLAVIIFANGWGVFHTDIKPEVYLAPGEMLPRYLSAWTFSPYLGSPNFNVGLVPVLVVTWLLRSFGLDPEMAFKVYHLILWALAAWGANRLLRTLVPRAGSWAGLVAGVAYIANPYAVASGGTLAIALPMALLPWLLIAVTNALRNPRGWAGPAAVGLVFFCMSGMNVGVVPVYQLLLVIPIALYVRSEQALRWGQIVLALAKSALFVILVSLYWLVPGVAARGTGTQIVAASESLDGIAKVSSFVEVLRGLGLWSYYGSGDAGPWIPEYAMYFTSGVIILFTVLWPAAALLSLRAAPVRLARLSAVCTAMVAVIMVGLYPGGYGSSPFAALLRVVFEHVGFLLAFRTTNKIGAGLALGFALVLGWAVARVIPRIRGRPGLAPAAGGLTIATVAALVAPAVTGNLYISPLEVPDYWHEAADVVDEGDPAKRALLLPGQVRPDYRWSEERPDDLPNSLFERDAVIPETVPNTSPSGANFLAALDATLQSGTAGSRDVSVFARYLGIDHVLLRHDIGWEDEGGARPGVTARALSEDEGLRGLANFGQPGQNTFTRGTPPESQEEALLPPLQLYGVENSKPMVRATPTEGSLVVAGDAWSIPMMAQQGLLEGQPAIRYAHDMDADELDRLLDSDNRMVLTDTNRRREAINNRLTAGQGAVLPPDESPDDTKTLGDDPHDQSTLVREGVRVEASMSGGAFFGLPYAIPENAIDGNANSSWLFGDFGRAKGETITLTLPESRTLDTIEVDTTSLGATKIDTLSVRAGDERVTAKVDSDGQATFDLGGVETDELTMRVEDLRGESISLVGISEIDLGADDLVAHRTIRTPETLSRLYADLSGEERDQFANTPLDVFFQRGENTPSPDDDTEEDLRRNFTLPDGREYETSAQVRVDRPLEPLADELAGLDTTYELRSSRTYFDDLGFRASKAADESSTSAWVPGGDSVDSWWQIDGPRRPIEEVTITQEPGPGDENDTAWATRATVLVDGDAVARGRIGEGTSTIELPSGTEGERVRVRIDAVDDSAGTRAPSFTNIDTGVEVTKTADEPRCMTVATIDGDPAKMRPKDPEEIAGPKDPATEWVGCSETSLAWGEHRLRPVEDVQLDTLAMRDVQGSKVTERPPSPVVQSDRDVVDSSFTVDVGPANGPYFLSIGQGYDPRWTATLEDGTDLGEPVVVNGYAVGWYIDDPSAHTVEIEYGPGRIAQAALGVSGLTLLAALAIFLVPAVRRRRAAIRTERSAVWESDAVSGPRPETEPAETGPAEEDTTEGVSATGRGRPVTRGLGETLADRTGRRRLALEAAVVAAAAVVTGIGGAVAALAAVVLLRRSRLSPTGAIGAGAALVVLAGVVLVIHLAVGSGTLGTVSADAVKTAVISHHIAGAGLVLAVIGTFLRTESRQERQP